MFEKFLFFSSSESFTITNKSVSSAMIPFARVPFFEPLSVGSSKFVSIDISDVRHATTNTISTTYQNTALMDPTTPASVADAELTAADTA